MNIKHIVFDFGGIIFPLTFERAVSRFKEIGLLQADTMLDRYKQRGFIGDLEDGSITPEEFLEKLSEAAGKTITWQQAQYAWMGYVGDIPSSHFDAVLELKEKGYQPVLLSNINPFVMEWALSDDFDGRGHTISHYFAPLFLSYRCGVMKPDHNIFRQLLSQTGFSPQETLFIDDGAKNIEAAQQLGFQTFYSKDISDWVEYVKRLPTIN